MTNKEFLLSFLTEQFNEYEAKYRHLCHQKAQPEQFRIIEADEEEIDKEIAFLVKAREAFQEVLSDMNAAPRN